MIEISNVIVIQQIIYPSYIQISDKRTRRIHIFFFKKKKTKKNKTKQKKKKLTQQLTNDGTDRFFDENATTLRSIAAINTKVNF